MYFLYFYHVCFYSFIYSYMYLSFVYLYSFLCFVIFCLSLSFLSFMHFCHVFLACSIVFISVCLSYIHIIYVFLSCLHLFIYFLSCSIYSFMYDNHMFTSYNLIFICAYHSCTLDYHILSYLIILYSYHIHVFLFLYECNLLRNWNQSNRIIQNKVMAFSCQLVNLPITLGTVCITHFSGVLTSFLTLGICTHLNIRC